MMTTTTLMNAPAETAGLSAGQLLDIAKQFGTPVYVYHAEKITSQFEKLRNALGQERSRIFFACKALTNINVLKHIHSIGCNVDCSSSNEVQLALAAGFRPHQILYTSNGVSFDEIRQVAALGVNVNIDSLSNLQKFAEAYGNGYPVGVRLRPNIMAGGNIKISTGHGNSKFGIPLEHTDRILDISKSTGLVIRGLHLHTGSDILDVDVFLKGVDVLLTLSEQFSDLQFLDLGGGFKVKYRPDDQETNIALLGEKLAEVMESYESRGGRKLQLWFEPGKFLVSEAGYLLASVNVMKPTPSATFAGLNTGLNHLIRPMFYDAWHTIENLSNPSGAIKPYTVTGYICETDTFATDRQIAEIHEGDVLAFRNAGAYGFQMSSNYNARFRPAEVMVKNGRAFLIRKSETFEDLLRNQVLDESNA